ncbi:MAG: SGNH/GDSL hydrolase family protein [Elusimicrobia bacterium]|nr:SGNH/GDSL hydrolase family protein [Elusimicrobiota bacterium]
MIEASGPRRQPEALPGRLRGAYVFAAVTLTTTAVLLLMMNAGAHVFLSTRNRLNDAVRMSESSAQLSRHLLAERFRRVYPHMGFDDVLGLLAETDAIESRYTSFAQYREAPRTGRFVNIDPGGFRRGAFPDPWPAPKDGLTVFVFGGSTAFGYGVQDADTIASALQAALGPMVPAVPVRVYNFGRCAYFSSLERTIFVKRILEGNVPGIAVFIDGTNEFDVEIRQHWLPYSETLSRMLDQDLETPASLLSRLAARMPGVDLTKKAGRVLAPSWGGPGEGRAARPGGGPTIGKSPGSTSSATARTSVSSPRWEGSSA